MIKYDAIVNPLKVKNSPDIGPLAVMVATPVDLFYLCELLNFDKNRFRRLFISRMYLNPSSSGRFSVTGPFIGAPYAAMLLETLIAWGARKIIFLGWCGAVSEGVRIGDIIVPTSAVIDEGTSRHYAATNSGSSAASSSMVSVISQALATNHIDFHVGVVWSTDALYRETRDKVEHYQRAGVLAVEMETSALYSVAQFRSAALGAILVVSDELSSFSWRPGFKQDRFIQGRQTACRIAQKLVCSAQENKHQDR